MGGSAFGLPNARDRAIQNEARSSPFYFQNSKLNSLITRLVFEIESGYSRNLCKI